MSDDEITERCSSPVGEEDAQAKAMTAVKPLKSKKKKK